MDNRGNIKPLDQFPEDERKKAIERLEKLENKEYERLREMLTDEGIAKVEAEIELRITHGDSE